MRWPSYQSKPKNQTILYVHNHMYSHNAVNTRGERSSFFHILYTIEFKEDRKRNPENGIRSCWKKENDNSNDKLVIQYIKYHRYSIERSWQKITFLKVPTDMARLWKCLIRKTIWPFEMTAELKCFKCKSIHIVYSKLKPFELEIIKINSSKVENIIEICF